MDVLRQDLRYALRTLAKSPAVSALAVLALAVALGVNGAIFSVVDAVLLRPFPFAEQDRLVILWQADRGRNQPFLGVSFPDFLDWRAQTKSFESLADMPSVNQSFLWTGDGEPTRIEGRLASADFFHVLGVLLAAVGIYGVMAHSVAQRTREMGVRVALGAGAWDVQRLVVGHGMGPALVGLALGAAGAAGSTRLAGNLLFGVGATDPLTFFGAAAFLAAVALLASYLPARRAARVDPTAALRYE